MELEIGFELEQPSALLRWGSRLQELQALLPGARRTASGLMLAGCVSMGGVAHSIGLYVRPNEAAVLAEIGIFREGDLDLVVSFDDFQIHLEATFGPSNDTRTGELGTTSHRWRVGGAVIVHELNYRFGPEEQLRIKGPGQPPFGVTPGDHIVWP